jgi:hypothetical protein
VKALHRHAQKFKSSKTTAYQAAGFRKKKYPAADYSIFAI